MASKIICPNCGMSLQIPREKVPEEGAWGRCTACRHRLFIEREQASSSMNENPETHQPIEIDDSPPIDGPPNAERASANRHPVFPNVFSRGGAWSPPPEESKELAPVPTPVPTDDELSEEAGPLILKDTTGTTTRLERNEIRQGILAGRILAYDLASDGNGHFEALQRHAFYGELFNRVSVRVKRHCWNHPDNVSEKICVRCLRCYCSECIPPPVKEGASHRKCWACDGLLEETDPGWREKPYWKRLSKVLSFPLGKLGAMITGGLAALLWLGSLGPAALPLYIPAVAILVYVMAVSAKGQQSLSTKPAHLDMRELAERSLVGVMVTAAMALPFFLINTYLPLGMAAILSFFLGLAVFGYHAMALGIAVLSDNAAAAFKPKFVIRRIFNMFDDYLTLLLGLLAVNCFLLFQFWALSFVPYVGQPLSKVFMAYGLIVQAHMVGWTFYLNVHRLGWKVTPPV